MIDVGFSSSDAGFVNRIFLALIALAGVLALASSARYYLVMTLGERIVADLRRDVFAHLLGCRRRSSTRRAPARSSRG